jgi:hypothetical protein
VPQIGHKPQSLPIRAHNRRRSLRFKILRELEAAGAMAESLAADHEKDFQSPPSSRGEGRVMQGNLGRTGNTALFTQKRSLYPVIKVFRELSMR